MKKTFLGLLFGVLVINVQLIAQSKPFIGYDKIAWGVSAQNVRQAYSIGDDVPLEVYDEDSNITALKQKNVSDNIYERTFLFNGNKLFRVVVEYKDGSDSTQSQLKGLLEQRYGTTTGINFQSGNAGDGLFFNIPYNDTINTFGKFAPDIEVQLIQRKYSSRTGFPPDIYVYYTWKKFWDEYQASKLGL